MSRLCLPLKMGNKESKERYSVKHTSTFGKENGRGWQRLRDNVYIFMPNVYQRLPRMLKDDLVTTLNFPGL